MDFSLSLIAPEMMVVWQQGWKNAFSSNNNATFHRLPMCYRQELYFCQQAVFGHHGKIGGRNLSYHGRAFGSRMNPRKVNGVFYLACNWHKSSLSAPSARGNLARDVIALAETGHRKSVEVLAGQQENKQLLENHLNHNIHAISVDDTEAVIGVVDKLGSLPLSDDIKEYAKDISELEDQLHELFVHVQKMIERGDEATARELIEANYEAVTQQLEMGIKGVEQAAMFDILAQLHMSLCDFKVAEHLLEQMKEIIVNVGNHEPLVDSILEHMANMYTTLEKPEEALPLYTRSLEIQEGVLGKDSPLLVNSLLGLASTYDALDEGLKSIETYRRAIIILEERRGAESEDLVLPLTYLAHVLIEETEVEEAEVSLRRALGIMEKSNRENDERVGVLTCVLARALCAKGEVNDAVRLYKNGLQIIENDGKLSLDDPVLETARTDLAELLHVLGREQESQEVWEKNLLVKEEAAGRDHPSLVVHLQNLATSYAKSGKFEKCEFLLRRALKILLDCSIPDDPEVSLPMLSLATTLYHLGKNEEAEDLAQEALRIREAFFDKQNPLIGEACDCLALIQHALGKDGEAEPLMWRVLQIQEKEFGYDSQEVMSTLEMLIVFLGNLGKKFERLSLLRRLTKLKAKYEK
eukprot:Gb_27651 [translate_table: standard]